MLYLLNYFSVPREFFKYNGIHCLTGGLQSGIRSYFRMVSEHKDIVRSVMALQGILYMYKPDIEKLLNVKIFVSHFCNHLLKQVVLIF